MLVFRGDQAGPWGARMKHHFWVSPRGCFWVRLAVESVHSVRKMVGLPGVGGPPDIRHPTTGQKATRPSRLPPTC